MFLAAAKILDLRSFSKLNVATVERLFASPAEYAIAALVDSREKPQGRRGSVKIRQALVQGTPSRPVCTANGTPKNP